MRSSRSTLITGAAGFLGGHTAQHFRSAGWEVVGVDRKDPSALRHPLEAGYNYLQNDLTSVESVVAMLNQHRPNVCIHLAGVASVGASFEDPLADFSAHTLPLLHVLEAVKLSRLKVSVLLVSSAAVYGNPESFPVREDAKIRPISPYGYHKYYQEMLLDQYRALYGLDVCTARVFSTYGPELLHLAVWDITRRAMQGDYTVYGTGEETRDYLYVRDVVSALCCIAEKAAFAGETINVASGKETPIITLAERIYAELGVCTKPRLCAGKSAGTPVRWCADISRLKRLGFEQEVKLDAGISATVEWIRARA